MGLCLTKTKFIQEIQYQCEQLEEANQKLKQETNRLEQDNAKRLQEYRKNYHLLQMEQIKTRNLCRELEQARAVHKQIELQYTEILQEIKNLSNESRL